jgi:multimeric flavodoxin WrbA
MPSIAIVYHSGYGHTEKVARLVAEGAASVSGVTVKVFNAEEAIAQLDALDTFDTIIFGAPTYMGSASAGFKTFADATAKKWFTQAWKDKVAAGFTNSGGLSGDKLSTLQSFSILAAQHGMIWVGLADSTPSPTSGHGATPDMINRIGSYLGLMTQSDNTSPENTPSPGDQETARRFGVRLAEITKRWVR